MELYNKLIKDTEELLSKGTPKAWAYNPSDAWADNGSSELVLQSDAAFELGEMGKGSANYLCSTTSAELVGKDETVLYGPDLRELKGGSPFARIVLVRVGGIEADEVSSGVDALGREVVFELSPDVDLRVVSVHRIFPLRSARSAKLRYTLLR